jgi:hypothetical protein
MLRRAGLVAALSALLLPAVAAGPATADAAKRSKRLPVVTKITPKHAFVGETLTIRGRHFRPGVNKNTVAFKRRGARVVFVKAAKGTKKLLKVVLPKRLEKVLLVRNGTPVPTRLQVRVISFRFGRKFTSVKRSPLVGPEKPPAPATPPKADPDGDCDGDGLINRIDTDDDNDLLADAYETRYTLDACNADTDGDGAEDGYEFASARDLNDDEHQEPNRFTPYPGKRPYPNPLDGTDGVTDHDGDSLTLKEEYDLWRYTRSRSIGVLTYSAGEQYSLSTRAGGTGHRTPSQPATSYRKHAEFIDWADRAGYLEVGLSDIGADLDDPQAEWWAPRIPRDIRNANRDTFLSNDERYYFDFGSGRRNNLLDDAERDEDADGLSNFAETRGCMNRKLWDGLFKDETPYPLTYPGTRLDDPDTDLDGVRDGADDQDHDDVPNIMECNRLLAAGLDTDPDPDVVFLGEDARDAENPRPGLTASGFVNPFNPCLPHKKSRTCKSLVDLGNAWAPFNEDDKYYFIWD